MFYNVSVRVDQNRFVENLETIRMKNLPFTLSFSNVPLDFVERHRDLKNTPSEPNRASLLLLLPI